MAGSDAAGRYTDDRLDGDCLELIIAILDNPIKSGNDYDNMMISAFAVMGLGQDGWARPMEYTPVYSAIVKVARMMVLH